MPDIIYRYRTKNGRYVYINEDKLGDYPDAIIYMTTPDGSKADLGTVRSLGMAYGDYEPDLTTEQRFNRLGIFFNEDTRTWQNGDGRIKISAPRTTTQRVSTSSEPTYEQRLIAIGYGLNPQTGRLEAPRLTNVAKRRVITDTNNPVNTSAAREIIDSELNGVGPYGERIFQEREPVGENPLSVPSVSDMAQAGLDIIDSTRRIQSLPETSYRVEPVARLGINDNIEEEPVGENPPSANFGLPSMRQGTPEAEAWNDRLRIENNYREMSELWEQNPDWTPAQVRARYSQILMDRGNKEAQQQQQQQQQNRPTSQNIIQRVGESIASVLSPASANATALVDSNQSVYDLGEVLSGQTVPGAKGKYVYYKNYPNLRGYAYANLEGLNPEFATRLGNFSNWYKENIGREFYGSSGYRDTEHQGKVRATQGKAAANPGYSYHGSGTAFDADWIAALSATKEAIRNNPNLLTEYNVSNEVELLDKALAQYGLERNMKDNPREQHHIQAIEDDAWMKAVNTELLLEHYKNGLLGTQLGSYYMRRRI